MARRTPIKTAVAAGWRTLAAASALLVLAASGPAGAQAAQAPGGSAQAALERLAWLPGCWRQDGAETGSGEHWLPAAGGTMLGVGRSVRRGVTVAHEFLQIREGADGGLVLVSQPSGKAEVVLALLPGGDTEAVFENRWQDYPQRVSYRLEEPGRLRLRLEGLQAGVPSSAEWLLLRSACDAQPVLPGVFQGLAWGATEQQMRQRFGPRLVAATCTPTSRQAAQQAGEACDHPTLAPYEVAGLPLRLNLHVDAQTRQLVRVSLVLSSEVPVQPGAGSRDENAWSDRHRVLRRLLTQRYGGPEFTHVDSEALSSHATARWRRGDTVIELQSVFTPRNGSAPGRERLELVYQPVTAGEAGKL